MRYHLHAEKRWVKDRIMTYGPKSVLGLSDLTKADALQLVDDLPSEFVPFEGCDNRNPDGTCAGHAVTKSEQSESAHQDLTKTTDKLTRAESRGVEE